MADLKYQNDAEAINDAVSGAGTDEDRLISIVTARSRKELQIIDTVYRSKYGNQLASRLQSEVGGNFGKALVNVVQAPEVTDAIYLHNSLSGAGTDEKVLNEILGTRTGAEIEQIKLAHVAIYNNSVEDLVTGDTTGKYENLLVQLLRGPRGRGDTAHVDSAKAEADAQSLHDQASDTSFNFILGNSSHEHNLAIAAAYRQKFGKSLEDAIKKNFSGHYEDLLVILVTPRTEYFADALHKAMKGFGTDDDVLIRIITTRYGVDSDAIERAYKAKQGKTLYEAVKSEISGDYKKLMLGLLAHSD